MTECRKSVSKSDILKRQNQNNGNDILKYFKRKKTNNATSEFCTATEFTSSDSVTVEASSYVIQNADNIEVARTETETVTCETNTTDDTTTSQENETGDESASGNCLFYSVVFVIIVYPTTTGGSITADKVPIHQRGRKMIESSNDKFFIDEVGVQLRTIETLLVSCQKLIRSSTDIDVCSELFVQQSKVYSEKIIQHGNNLQNVCTNILSIIDENRSKITVTDSEQYELVDRDPGRNYIKMFQRAIFIYLFFV